MGQEARAKSQGTRGKKAGGGGQARGKRQEEQEQTIGPVPRAMGEGGGANDKLCAREGAR